MTRTFIYAVALVPCLTLSAVAQQSQQGGQSGSQQSASTTMEQFQLPEACRNAAQTTGGSTNASMQNGSSQTGASMAGMTQDQQALMQAMMQMTAAMKVAMQAKDPDVAFACSTIPHHEGMIAMAQVELKYGNNKQAKDMAKKLIKDQQKSIGNMKQWLTENAAKATTGQK